MVKPEARVECGGRKVGHVSGRGGRRTRATKSRVDGVVDALERVGAPGVSSVGVGESGVVLASAEHLVDLVLERGTDVVEGVGGTLGGAASGVCVTVGVAQSDRPVDERSVDQAARRLEVVTEQRVDNGLLTGGRLDRDVLVAHDVGQRRVAWLRVCSPVPVGEAHGRGSSSHESTAVIGVLVCELADDGHERLLEQGEVGTVPGGEKYGVVGAVTVRPAAAAALADTVPVLARHTVDAGNLVVGHPVALAHALEPLQAEDEESPLVGLVEEHLPHLKARVDAISSDGDTSDGHEASRLPLLDVVVLFEQIVDILGEWLRSSVGESRRSERQGKENGRELHDCGEGVAHSMSPVWVKQE